MRLAWRSSIMVDMTTAWLLGFWRKSKVVNITIPCLVVLIPTVTEPWQVRAGRRDGESSRSCPGSTMHSPTICTLPTCVYACMHACRRSHST
ncbi:hypothetical protein BDV30DRAFT_210709 [Aspergillus minisclerotigenes]|uniref:Uncharacterized protein n=1 Tax=Aspergillus minisclerotigenes TaxID=656917 RepID=A0A5N6J4Q4_9EURO|nr:hypothetical protein BDV30DRAFT_210709 [Aspergillus minisclerotigenes]